MHIGDNDALRSVFGFAMLESVGGYLEISYNDVLTHVPPLGSLTSVGGYLEISYNDVLTFVPFLGSLTSVGGYLHINGNDALETIPGFDRLESVGGDLDISFNDVLRSLPPFTALRSIGSTLDAYEDPIIIAGNSMLSTCCGVFPFLQDPLPDGYTLGGDRRPLINENAAGCNSRQAVRRACGHEVSVSTTTTNVRVGRGDDSTIPISLPADGTEAVFTIDLGGRATGFTAVEASDPDNFVSSVTASGTRGERLTISYSENTSPSSRTARITLSTTGEEGIPISRTLSLTQEAAEISITGFSPTTGRIGDEITIRGTAFSTTASDNDVSFGGSRFDISSAADAHEVNADGTELKVRVPRGAESGKLRVRVGGRTGTVVASTANFTITNPTDPSEPSDPARTLGVSHSEGELVLYPNPVGERFHIGGLQSSALVRISMLGGVVVRRAVVPASSSFVDVSDLGGGTYVAVIESIGSLSRQLVIIQ